MTRSSSAAKHDWLGDSAMPLPFAEALKDASEAQVAKFGRQAEFARELCTSEMERAFIDLKRDLLKSARNRHGSFNILVAMGPLKMSRGKAKNLKHHRIRCQHAYNRLVQAIVLECDAVQQLDDMRFEFFPDSPNII